MTAPRSVHPGRYILITRSTADQRFFMRPDEETNNNFLYCLGEAAQRHEIRLIASGMLSNHHHTVGYDEHGHVNEFDTRFHGFFARSQNALRGRTGYHWDASGVSVVIIETFDKLIEAIAYSITNPVKHGLVENYHSWPGLNSFAALKTGRTLRAYRPDFFREFGGMPETVDVTFELPDELGDRDAVIALIEQQVATVEAVYGAERRQSNKPVLGRRRVLRQSWHDVPSTVHPRGGLKPRVKAKAAWMRKQFWDEECAFRGAYRRALMLTRAGDTSVFPAGTYGPWRFMGVAVEPPRPLRPLLR